jgi:hypothetical protein
MPKKDPAPGSYVFETYDGKKHTLPPIDEAKAGDVPGEISYYAILHPDDEGAQARLTIATVEAQDLAPATKAALLSLKTGDMITAVFSWMGESTGSSTSSPGTEEPSSTTGEPASHSPSPQSE